MKHSLMDLSWVEIEKLDKKKTVVFIGIAPIEEHGRHLPIGVDVYETEFWVKHSIEKLEIEFGDFKFLTLPVITYGHGNLKGFVGNIHLSQRLIYKVTLETLNAIMEWGIKNVVIISAHADPKHLIAIEQACEKINKEYGITAFAPMGAIFSHKMKNEKTSYKGLIKKLEEFPNDFHAGWIETSCMLSIKPSLVSESYIKEPDIEIKDREMIFPKKVMNKTKGLGHLGYPREASKVLGDELNDDVSEKIRACTSAFINRKGYTQYEHHKLYNVPFMKVKKWGW